MRLQALVATALSVSLIAGCNSRSQEETPAKTSAAGQAVVAAGFQARVLSAKELKAHQDKEGVVIVDVRPPESYEVEHIAGAVNVPWAKLKDGYAQLPKDRFIALYCT